MIPPYGRDVTARVVALVFPVFLFFHHDAVINGMYQACTEAERYRREMYEDA